MLARYITPRIVAVGLSGEVLLLSALYMPSAFGWTPRFRVTEALVMTVAGILAFGIALLLSLEVAAEFRQARWSYLAWMMLAANAAISLVKRSAGSPLFDFVTAGYRTSPLRGLLDNLLVVPANVCLLIGLLAMWWGYHKLGLGFRIEWRDRGAMAGVAALFLMLLLFRGSLSQGQSPYLISRALQPLGLTLLAVISTFGVVLHRYAVRMGDGKLALVMRWLMFYVLLRGVLVLARSFLSPGRPLLLDSPPGLEDWAFDVLWQVVQWTAAMAAAYCAQLPVSAAQQLKQLRAARPSVVRAQQPA
ncbi:MAG TPA: hypothetical protein VKF81_15890 [Blastocatellia bacterium]|nr:hypothetical protein [Blastocatellia bacterium]